MKIISLAVMALTLLVGCGTPAPSNYYLLSAEESRPEGHAPSLGVGPIDIPEYLNRNGLVYNQIDNRLQIASHERWAEPLVDGIARVVSLNLSGLLGTESIQAYPWPRSETPDYGVRITVMSLDANDHEATLVAEWVVHKPGEGEYLSRRLSQFSSDLPAGEVRPEQIAPAYSDLLHQLSELITQAIRDDMAAGPPST